MSKLVAESSICIKRAAGTKPECGWYRGIQKRNSSLSSVSWMGILTFWKKFDNNFILNIEAKYEWESFYIGSKKIV